MAIDAKGAAFEQWMRTFSAASDDQTLASLISNDVVWAMTNQMYVMAFVWLTSAFHLILAVSQKFGGQGEGVPCAASLGFSVQAAEAFHGMNSAILLRCPVSYLLCRRRNWASM